MESSLSHASSSRTTRDCTNILRQTQFHHLIQSNHSSLSNIHLHLHTQTTHHSTIHAETTKYQSHPPKPQQNPPVALMPDSPHIPDRQTLELARTTAEIAEIEQTIALKTTEIARRTTDDAHLEEVRSEKKGLEAALRTLRLLEGARRVEMCAGRNAAGVFLGENIGKEM